MKKNLGTSSKRKFAPVHPGVVLMEDFPRGITVPQSILLRTDRVIE